MPVLVFRNERSVADLGDRLFTRLGKRQRERVEAALLAANPQLANLRDVPEGAVLRVPDMPELNHKRKPDPETPEDARRAELTDALESFGSRFDKQIRQAGQRVTEQKALLRSATFRKAWQAGHRDRAQAKKVNKALERREEALNQRRQLLKDALDDLLGDLRK